MKTTTNGPHAPNTTDPFEGIDLGQLERSLLRPRTIIGVLATGLVSVLTCLALVPLFSVLWMLLRRGSANLSWATLSQLPPAPLEAGGGIGNALVGTLVMVGLAGLIAVPLGMLSGVYLAHSDSRAASSVRFAVKLMTGLPSILAGVFAYGSIVLLMGGFSALAGGLALALLMFPTIVLTSEEAIRAVPVRVREAAMGMGATRTQATCMIVLPAAASGILTGIMLAIARAAGETAPLLFTALFSHYWIAPQGQFSLREPTASLAVLIYNFAGVPFDNQVALAWTAALVLVFLVLVTNLAGQALSPRNESQR